MASGKVETSCVCVFSFSEMGTVVKGDNDSDAQAKVSGTGDSVSDAANTSAGSNGDNKG